MRTLKNIPLRRWYRIKDNVVYDILPSTPSNKIAKDYVQYDSAICKLPYIELTYGFINDNNVLTTTKYVEKLYLDIYIEKGDTVIVKKDSITFEPNINNSEDDNIDSPSYISIHEYELRNDLFKKVMSNANKEVILNSIPFYFKTVDKTNVVKTSTKTVYVNGEATQVNCIYSVDVVNCGSAIIKDYQINYNSTIIEMINKYISSLALELTKIQIPNMNVGINKTITINNMVNYELNITDIEKATVLLGKTFDMSQVITMYIDNILLDKPVQHYQFSEKGIHSVTIALIDNLYDMSNMFNGCEQIVNIDLTNIDTSHVNNMKRTFYGCNALQTLDVSNFNVREVETTSEMFAMCTSIKNLILFKGNSNLEDMSGMFEGMESIETITTSGILKTGGVKNMSNLFSGCIKLKTLTKWSHLLNNRENLLTDTSKMFKKCHNISQESINDILKLLKTANVTNMSYMFNETGKNSDLIKFDLSNLDISKVTDMSYMFANTKAQTILISNISAVTSMVGTFAQDTNNNPLDFITILGNINDASGINTTDIFLNLQNRGNGCIFNVYMNENDHSWLTDKLPSNWKKNVYTSITNTYMVNKEDVTFEPIKLLGEPFDMSQVSRMYIDNDTNGVAPQSQYIFTENGKHTVKFLMNHNFKNSKFFAYRCNELTESDWTNCNTNTLFTTSSTFTSCNNLKNVVLRDCNMAQVENFNEMFSLCPNLNKITKTGTHILSNTTDDKTYTMIGDGLPVYGTLYYSSKGSEKFIENVKMKLDKWSYVDTITVEL